MSIEPEHQGTDRKNLAEALKRLRLAAGLSGQRLAVRCSMSQAKISRIETGKILPTVMDVDRILKALQVPAAAAGHLLDLARMANIGYTSWRSYARVGLWRKQVEIKALTQASTVIRQFLPAIPTGLLQVPEYARKTLTPIIPGRPARDVDKAVQARLDRQAALDDPSRRFVLLMTEQAVRWRRAGTDVMVKQLKHMTAVAQKPNVEIAVLPLSATIPASPLNIFVVYDDRLVVVELFSGEVALHDPQDVAYHLNLFELFLEHALTGSDATDFLNSVADEFMQDRE